MNVGTYQGETWYFTEQGVYDRQNLTMDICNKYGLACRSW